MQRRWTVAALVIGMFMGAMEATVVGTAMPTVIAELGGLALYGWVGSVYLLASTVTVPLYGKLADLYGRRPVLIAGIALFLAGSVGSGFAPTMEWLIFARAIQGLGAGATQPITLTIIGDLYTLEERGRVQGFFGAVWGIAGVAGPLVGGFLVHALSWRWVFWINVPFGVGSIALLVAFYRESFQRRADHAIDWLGAGVLLGASVLLLIGVGGEQPWFTIPAGAALVVAFVLIEKRVREPVLPLDLITRRAIAVASISGGLLSVTMMGTLMFAPLFIQGVMRRDPTEAGGAIAPMLVGWPIAATLTSRMLVKVGFRAPVRIGAAVCAVALVAFAGTIGRVDALWILQAIMFVFGIGMGLANTALIIGVQSGVEHHQRGVATATAMFSRSMGAAFGAGALGAVLAHNLAGHGIPTEIAQKLLDPHAREAGLGLAADVAARVEAGLGAALAPVFWVIAGVSIANLLVVSMYPDEAQTRASTATSPTA